MKAEGEGLRHVEARAMHGARFRYFDFVMVAFVVVLLLSNVIGAEKRSFVDLPGMSVRGRSAPGSSSSRSPTSSMTC